MSSAIPCALQGYLSKRPSNPGSRQPSDEDCQMVFLNWVAYVKELSPDVQEDHLKCPMYKCRQGGFHDMMTFLRHVSSCVWLSKADYWCPYCCRQEHFGVSELERGPSVVGQPSKESKIKKARDFFKRFGRTKRRNPILTEELPYYHYNTRAELESTTSSPITPDMYFIPEPPEMYAKVIFSTSGCELDDTSPSTMRERVHSLTSPYRLRKSSQHAFWHELRVSTYTLGRREMPGPEPYFYWVELPSPDGYTLLSELTGVTHSVGQCTPTLVSTITSPVVNVDPPQYVCQEGICVAPTELDPIPTSETDALDGGNRAICWRAFASLRVEHSNKIIAQARVKMYEQGAASTLAYVEALRQLSCVLKNLWQALLKDWPDLCCHIKAMEIDSPLDDGLRGLKECLSGKLPTTLPEVLPLVCLGYACAYMCYGEDWSYAWDVFYQNVLQWGDAIADQQDRYRFLQIAEILWSIPQASHQPTATMLLAEPLWEEGRERPSSSIAPQLKMHNDDAMVPRQHHAKPMESAIPASLHALLVSGPVIECCSRVLDGRRGGLPVRGAGYEPAGTACLQAVFSRAKCPHRVHIKNVGVVVDANVPSNKSSSYLDRTTTTATTAASQSASTTACGETRIIEEPRPSQSAQRPIYPPTSSATRALPVRESCLKSTGTRGPLE